MPGLLHLAVLFGASFAATLWESRLLAVPHVANGSGSRHSTQAHRQRTIPRNSG